MDDLTSKLVAAAETAIKEATPPEAEETTETAQAAPDEIAPEAPAAEGEEGEEAAVEEPESDVGEAHAEEAPPPADLADEILAVRASAERKVRSAEKRVAALEAQLEKASQAIEMSRRQVAEDIFKKLRRSPARAAQEFGVNFQDVIEAAIREHGGQESPLADGLDELKQEIQALKREREESRQAQEQQRQQQQLHAARNEFLSQVEKSEFPTLYNMFYDDRDALWREAMAVGREHHRKYGSAPEDIEVIKHLEQKYKARIARLGGGEATAAAAAAKKPVAKSLSTKAASETRTSGKPFGQLSADEQRDVLLAAAKKARQPSASN